MNDEWWSSTSEIAYSGLSPWRLHAAYTVRLFLESSFRSTDWTLSSAWLSCKLSSDYASTIRYMLRLAISSTLVFILLWVYVVAIISKFFVDDLCLPQLMLAFFIFCPKLFLLVICVTQKDCGVTIVISLTSILWL